MTINQLRYFIAIYQYKKLRLASERLHIAEPSISASLKKLEDEIGYLLFTREKNSLVPTAKGQIFFSKASKLVADFDAFEAEVTNSPPLPFIHIAVPNIMESYLFDSFIPEFKKQYPHVRFNVLTSSSVDSVESLLTGKADLAIVNQVAITSPKLEFSPLISTHLLGIVRKDHPLASQDNISWNMLRSESMIFISERSIITQQVLQKCADAGFQPNIAMFSKRTDLTLKMVKQNNACAFFMDAFLSTEKIAAEFPNDFAKLNLADCPSFNIGIARYIQSPISEEAASFYDFCSSTFHVPIGDSGKE